MPPRSFVALLAVITLLVVAAPAAVLGAPQAAHVNSGSTGDTAGSIAQETATTRPIAQETTTATPQTPDPAEPRAESHTTMRLQIQPDGDARWRVSATFPIRDANDSAAFNETVKDFERADSPLGLDTFKLAANDASTATGREMELRNITRSHFRENGTGTLVLSFTWPHFARVNGDQLAVGDAFNTTSGTWLPDLPRQTILIIAPPEGYGVSDAPQVGIVGGAARWDGPYVFAGPEPWIVYSGDAPTPAVSATPGSNVTSPGTGTESNGTETPPPDGPLSSALPILILVAAAAVIAAILAVYLRSDEEGIGGIGPTTAGDGDNPDSGGAAESAPSNEPGAESGNGTGGSTLPSARSPGTTAPENGDGVAAGTGAGASAAASDAGAEDEVDEALLSDEERVERLLERNGGRMKQASIVKETGWSNAKVSQLLSAMAEDDRIDKLRIGRENLISFPDEDVTDIDSE